MDASASDFEMSECVNGHVFCDSHAKNIPTLTPTQLRQCMESRIKEDKYSSEEDKQSQLKELVELDDLDLEDYFNDNFRSDGVSECQCPICNFQSLKQKDGFNYLKTKHNLTDDGILSQIRGEFKTYKDLVKFLNNGE
jgi:hypothetical protein